MTSGILISEIYDMWLYFECDFTLENTDAVVLNVGEERWEMQAIVCLF